MWLTIFYPMLRQSASQPIIVMQGPTRGKRRTRNLTPSGMNLVSMSKRRAKSRQSVSPVPHNELASRASFGDCFDVGHESKNRCAFGPAGPRWTVARGGL